MHLLRLVVALSCALLLACSAQAFTPCTDAGRYTPIEMRYTRGLLFKVEKCHQPVSYIFGTAHLAQPEIAEAAANAFKILKAVQAAGFELEDPDSDAIQATLAPYIHAPPGEKNRLSVLLGKEYFAKLVAELNFMAMLKGSSIKPEILDTLRPWVLPLILEMANEDKGFALDEKLWIAATLAKKTVFGLETAQEQIDIFATLPDALQLRILKDTIDHYPEMLRYKQELIKAYLAKDGRKIRALEEQEMGNDDDSDREANELLRYRLLVKRNKTMVERLLPRLNTQSVLLSVGMMHLLGNDGILRLLEQNGYFITPMP